MKGSFVFIIVLISICAFALEPDTLWTRTYGGSEYDGAYSVQQTSDGNFIIAGYTRSYGQGGNDFYLLMIDGTGDTLWTKTYGGDFGDVSYSVQQTSDGGFILTGSSSSFGGSDSDFYLVKTNSTGDTTWTKTYGGGDHDRAKSVQETTDGGFIIAGSTRSYGAGSNDFWLVKTDSQGQVAWSKTYGGSSNDEAECVQQTADGGYIIAGFTSSFGVDPDDAYLVRTNSSGDTLWTHTYGSSLDEDVRSVQETYDGGFIASGGNLFLLRTNSSGDTLWTRRYAGSGVLFSVQQLPDRGYIAAGSNYSTGPSDFYVIRIDSTGDTLWTRTYGGGDDDIARSIQQTSDGGYIVAGETRSFGAGEIDFYVVRLSPDPRLRVLDPNGGEEWPIFQSHEVSWWGYGFDSVRIELNRDYPAGDWETLALSTLNDGSELVYIDSPPSEYCRIRVSALEDTSVDVSDEDFSIVSSQGYLGLVCVDAPATPIESWDAGVTECPDSFTESLRLKNFGSEAIVVFQPLEPTSNEFARDTDCGIFFALTPNQMSSCSLALTFEPSADGNYIDTLYIQTDAINADNGFVRFPLYGSQISTPLSPELVVTIESENSRISWDEIIESVGGCPITVQRYLLFFAEDSDGPYWYLGGTTDTTYVHIWAVSYASNMFYKGLATISLPPALIDLPDDADISMKEVVEKLKE